MDKNSIKKTNWNIILVLFVYSFITVTHIMLLPSYRSQNFPINQSHNSIFKRKEISPASTNFMLRRLCKVIINDKSISFNAAFFLLCISLLFFIPFFEALRRKRKLVSSNSRSFFGNQYAYLTLCTFRI
jgi:hypothetical protein